MKIRYYKGDKTLCITTTQFTPEFRLSQIAKQGQAWALEDGIKWQIDGDIEEPKPKKKPRKKTAKK